MSEPVRGHADEATVNYFDSHAHHYSNQRIKGVADLISHRVTPTPVCVMWVLGGGKPLSVLRRSCSSSSETSPLWMSVRRPWLVRRNGCRGALRRWFPFSMTRG